MRRVLLISFSLLVIASPANAERYPIALTGDSITESAGVRTSGWEGFGDQLRQSLESRGVLTGGYGFVPMHRAVCCDRSNSFVPWKYTGQWQHLGAIWSKTQENNWAANGLPSLGTNAAVESDLWADRIGIQYLQQPGGGKIEVWLDGGKQTVLQTSSTKPANRLYWLSTSWKQHHLRLKTIGNAVLLGMIASHAPGKQSRVEIDQIGHGGDESFSNFRPLQQAAMKQLAPKITLVMFGANEEMTDMIGGGDSRAKMLAAMVARGKLARQTGSCIFVHHPPLFGDAHRLRSDWLVVQARYSQTGKDAAKTAGCQWLDLWDNLWEPTQSYSDGWTLDGLHPTINGYHAMSEPLADWLASHYALPRS